MYSLVELDKYTLYSMSLPISVVILFQYLIETFVKYYSTLMSVLDLRNYRAKKEK